MLGDKAADVEEADEVEDEDNMDEAHDKSFSFLFPLALNEPFRLEALLLPSITGCRLLLECRLAGVFTPCTSCLCFFK